ncbi:hypothetical protein HN51_056634, partial [Arachis hypogaea]
FGALFGFNLNLNILLLELHILRQVSQHGSCADRNIWQEFQTTPSILQDVSQQLLELFCKYKRTR